MLEFFAIQDLGSLLQGVDQVNPDDISWMVRPYLTWGGFFANLTQGIIAFFIVRFAEKVTTDPEYEERVWARYKNNKKKR